MLLIGGDALEVPRRRYAGIASRNLARGPKGLHESLDQPPETIACGLVLILIRERVDPARNLIEVAPTVRLHEHREAAQRAGFELEDRPPVTLSGSTLTIISDRTAQPTPCDLLPFALR
jgi:hypothetical protein